MHKATCGRSPSVSRQEECWSKRLSVDNDTNAVYENINVVGVYSPGGTNDDIVTTVTGIRRRRGYGGQ